MSTSLTQWSMSTELKTSMQHHTASLMQSDSLTVSVRPVLPFADFLDSYLCGLHGISCGLISIAVDVPLWIETEGAVQHVKDYIVHYKLSPPSAPSSSTSIGDENDDDGDGINDDADDDSADGNEDEEDEEGATEDAEEISENKASRKSRQERDDQDNEESNADGDGDVADLDMYIGMYETAIEMAAESDLE